MKATVQINDLGRENVVSAGQDSGISLGADPLSPSDSVFDRRSSSTALNLGHFRDFGSCSLFDCQMSSAEELPIELPVEKYFAETLAGLKDAPAESGNWRRLRGALATDMAKNACLTLAWVCIGLIFGTVCEDALAELRQQLSQSWFELKLDISRKIKPHHGGRKDWMLDAMPAVMVQSIYRMMVDGFPPEKKRLQEGAEIMIEKLTHLAHHEVAGFEVHGKAWQELRGDLFYPSVIQTPFANARDAAKTERKREVLQNEQRIMNKVESAAVLEFGQSEDATALTVQQLQDLMAARSEKKSSKRRSFMQDEPETSGAAAYVPDFNVDRYKDFAQKGEELFLSHLVDIYPENSLEEEVETLGALDQNFDRKDSSDSLSDDEASPDPLDPSRQLAPSRSQTLRAALDPTATVRREREKREAEVAELKRRNDLFTNAIEAPFAAEFRKRSWDTNMVSPLVSRLAPDRGNCLLPPLQSLTRQVKMSPPIPACMPAPSMLKKSASEPVLMKRRMARRTAVAMSPRSAEAFAMDSAKKLTQTVGVLPKIGGVGSQSSEPPKRRNSKAGLPGLTILKDKSTEKSITLIMEPSATLKSDLVVLRLERAREALRANSYDELQKTGDAKSGVAATHYDDKRLRQDENDFVSRIESLVGSRSSLGLKQLNPARPHQSVTRSSHNRSSSRSLKAPGNAPGGRSDSHSPSKGRPWNELTHVN